MQYMGMEWDYCHLGSPVDGIVRPPDLYDTT